MDENHLIDVIKVYKHIDLNKEVIEQENELELDGDDDLPEVADPDNVAQEITENSELIAMFWADEVSKCNYKEFGDIVSFDATFNNNNNGKGKDLNINEGCKTVIVRDKGTNAYRTLNTKNGKEQEKESEQWRKQ
ncbi:hypothetical protein Tco_0784814 [Tanacetum coccineum]